MWHQDRKLRFVRGLCANGMILIRMLIETIADHLRKYEALFTRQLHFSLLLLLSRGRVFPLVENDQADIRVSS